eukprot:PhM_4_TR17420/c1_g2_i1/m.78058
MGAADSKSSDGAADAHPSVAELNGFTDAQLLEFLRTNRIATTNLTTRADLTRAAMDVVHTLGLDASGRGAPQPPRPRGLDVYLNVYNLVPKEKNDLLGSLGFGLYHSGVELLGWEWSFGGVGGNVATMNVDPNMPGVFFVPPRSALPPDSFCEHVFIGTVYKTPEELGTIVDRLRRAWPALSYHPLSKNCNHFTEVFLKELDATFQLPAYINRAARVANFVIPDALYNAVMERTPHAPDIPQAYPAPNTSNNSNTKKPMNGCGYHHNNNKSSSNSNKWNNNNNNN